MDQLDWPSTLLSASGCLEQALVIAASCALAALVVVARRTDSSHHQPLRLSRSTELTFVLLIVAGALLTRLLGYTATDEPRWWFAQRTPLRLHQTLVEGGFLGGWLDLLQNTQARTVHTSAVLMPVAAVFQLVAGPSFHLAQLVGTFWGVMTVVAAWGLGRVVVSPVFGVLFAGFVAFSPLQVVWSRLGSIPIGGGAHVLAALAITHVAARRRSPMLGLLAGLTCWTLLYNYQAARAGILLALITLFTTLWRTYRLGGRRLPVCLAFASGLVLPLTMVNGTELREILWPRYPGYLGNRGETGFAEIITSVYELLRQHAGRTARVYFWSGRVAPPYAVLPLSWGMEYGGLCYLPVTLLAFIGCLRVARRWREQSVWLAFAAVGFAIPCMTAPTARRLLLFDVAWCALAAHGLLGLLSSGMLTRLPARTRVAIVATCLIALGVWTSTAVTVLNAALPRHPSAPIPFGESGFGDGSTCIGCVRAARDWYEEIRQHKLVVLFDSDMERESRTIPAGLPMYGSLAALMAGRPDSFVQYYAVAENFDLEPSIENPFGEALVYDRRKTDFASFLARRLDDSNAAEIIWHFERPTQWERFLAERLAAMGGHARTLDRESLSRPGEERSNEHPIEVRTPWTRRREALQAIVEISAHSVPPEPGCFVLERAADRTFQSIPLLLAGHGLQGDPPEWAVGGYLDVERPPILLPGQAPAGLGFDRAGNLRILRQDGSSFSHAQGRSRPVPDGLQTPPPIGRNCAVFNSDHWWVVDPLLGRLLTTASPGWTMPAGRWSGIAPYGQYQLVLAGADQTIRIIDTRDGSMQPAFDAIVSPSRRFHFGECSPITAGDDWIATYDHFSARLTISDASGNGRTVLPLDRELEVSPREVIGIAGYGSYLGVTHGTNPAAGTHVTTFTVRRLDDWPPASPPGRASLPSTR